ncbi:hypothetical protein MXD63_33535 [Frankia sp. Cpl3]|nr:hypothetical protein [Frankia sp. Cpl3]
MGGGTGTEIVLAYDLVVSADTATFGPPEVSVDCSPWPAVSFDYRSS